MCWRSQVRSGAKAALGDGGHDLGHGLFGGGEELGGGQRAQGVGREIAKLAGVPVDVLHAPILVVRRLDAEGRRHARPPRAGKIRNREIAGEQRALEPVAQDDVERIGRFVGLDADEPGLDADIEAAEIVRLPARSFAGKGVADERRQKADELRAPARVHLHEEGLALVHRHAA